MSIRASLVLCLATAVSVAGEVPYIGVELAPVGEELGAFLGISGGARIVTVEAGSPAEAAEIKTSDIVIAWGGAEVKDPSDLAEKVKAAEVGKQVNLKVLRQGKAVELSVSVGKREVAAEPKVEEEKVAGYLGIGFNEVPSAVAEYLDLGEKPGVAVVEVVEGAPAQRAGLKVRDIIRKVSGAEAENPLAFKKLMEGFKEGDAIEIEYIRAGRPEIVKVTLAARPKELLDLRPGRGMSFRLEPRVEGGRGKIILRWRDADGKEREEVIPGPFEGFPDRFEFRMPEFHFPRPFEHDALKRYIEESMGEAKRHLERFSEKLKEKHEKLRRKLSEGRIEVSPRTDSKAVVIQKSSACVSSSDGVHEISIVTEDGKKTVTVKKESGEVIAQDLPFEKIDTLPESVREKIVELEKGIQLEIKEEGPAREMEEKRVLGLPTKSI